MPRRREEDINQMGFFFNKQEARDWVQLADEGVQWWALVNMVTNSRAPAVKEKFVPMHAMKACGGVEILRHSFLTLVLVGGEWSASRPRRFIPGERAIDSH
jgi:hypothetical protein